MFLWHLEFKNDTILDILIPLLQIYIDTWNHLFSLVKSNFVYYYQYVVDTYDDIECQCTFIKCSNIQQVILNFEFECIHNIKTIIHYDKHGTAENKRIGWLLVIFQVLCFRATPVLLSNSFELALHGCGLPLNTITKLKWT